MSKVYKEVVGCGGEVLRHLYECRVVSAVGVCWKKGLRPIIAGVYINLVLIGAS